MTSGFSFDCSWNSCGWQGKEGAVAAISERTRKLVDVVHKSQSYLLCIKMKGQRGVGKISGLDYMIWFVKHGSNSMMNHTGSTSVSNTAFSVLLRFNG